MSTLDMLDTQEEEPEERVHMEFPSRGSIVPDKCFGPGVEFNHVMAALSATALSPPTKIVKSPRRPTCLKLTMPLPSENLSLHSPSDQIVGTPFSVNNSPRFEYPFPQSNANSIESTPSLTHSPFSSSSSISTVSSPNSLILSPLLVPLERHYSPTHPKLCTADPPVPPSLLKKTKWAVGLLSRKSNNNQKYSGGGGKIRDGYSKHSLEGARTRRFSVGTPPELYTTPIEGPEGDVEDIGFFGSSSGLNRTTSAQC